MKRIMLLAGLALALAAGTASAQTSVQLSLGFGVPRPYVSGYVFVGRPHLRPVYRPYHYRPYRYHRNLARPHVYYPAPYSYRPQRRVIIVDRYRHQRFDRDRRDRFDRDRRDRFRDRHDRE
jgi:hypothetical protein